MATFVTFGAVAWAGIVEVTVYEDGALFPNNPVLFLDAADTVVLQGITNAHGVASATMLPGGSVTTVLPAPSGFAGQRVFTYLDVKPGDHLVVGTPGQPPVTTAPLLLPSYPAATGYRVAIISPELQRSDTKDKQTFYVRAPFATTSTIDVSTPPTPWFKSAMATATTNEIQVYEDGTGMMDVTLVRLLVERSFDDYYFWTVAGPYTPSGLRLPELTGSLAEFNLQTGIAAYHAGFAYTARLAGGWDSLRADVMNQGSITTHLLRGGGVVATSETSIVP